MPQILDFPTGTPAAGDQSLFHDVSGGKVKRFDPTAVGVVQVADLLAADVSIPSTSLVNVQSVSLTAGSWMIQGAFAHSVSSADDLRYTLDATGSVTGQWLRESQAFMVNYGLSSVTIATQSLFFGMRETYQGVLTTTTDTTLTLKVRLNADSSGTNGIVRKDVSYLVATKIA